MTLKPCPDSPNCVTTQTESGDTEHYMEPVSYEGDQVEIIAAIVDTVTSNGGSVVSSTETSVEALFVTGLFKFKDDVSFELDDEAKLLHFRSASRVGHSDLGANRKRMADLIPRVLSRLG